MDRSRIKLEGSIIAEVAKCFSMFLESLLASLLCHMYQMCLTMHEMLVFPFATNVNNLEYIHKTIKLFMKLQLFFLKAKKRVFLIEQFLPHCETEIF